MRPSINDALVSGPGKAERSSRLHIFCVWGSLYLLGVCSPSNADIDERDVSLWATIEGAEIAAPGDILASRWDVLIRGDLQINVVSPCFDWRPIGSFCIRRCELGVFTAI